MHRPVLVSAPASYPVELADAKAACRVTHHDENSVIEALIKAATAHLDGWTGILGRCLITQTWRATYERFEQCMRVPLGPVQSVVIKYRDETGAQSDAIDGSNYELQVDGAGYFVRFNDTYELPADLYETAPVMIEFVAGEDQVPSSIKTAILLLVAHWYQNREALASEGMQQLPFSVDALLAPHRKIHI